MTALLADIGGTNARFALLPDGAPLHGLEARRSLRNADHATGEDAVAAYLAMVGQPALSAVCLAVAGPVVDGQVAMTNRGWRFSETDLADQLGTAKAVVLNDFEALAWSLDHLRDDDLRQLLPGEARPLGARVVVGPGTGLGVAAQVRDRRGQPVVVTSEGGHMAFGPPSDAFLPVLSRLATGGRVVAEDLISGPGLRRLHAAIAAAGSGGLEEADIETRARAGSDAACVRAVELFLQALVGFASDLALAFNASGGVYLGGGVLDHLSDLLPADALHQWFRDRPEPLLQKTPVYRIQGANAALVGAAARLRAA